MEMKALLCNWGALAALTLVLSIASAPEAMADGTETLGPPEIPIASGSGFVTAGTGLASQPNTIAIDVPDGAVVEQVLLYWTGEFRNAGDDTLLVNGTEVVGTLIGGPSFFFPYQGDVYAAAYRADITDLQFITDGPNMLDLEGLSFDQLSAGAGVFVVYDDGATTADIQIADGLDLAFFKFSPPRDATVPQTFSFASEDVDRVAELAIFAGSVGEDRPNAITIDVDGEITELTDPLTSADGESWDSLVVPVDIPAGTTEATVQVHSSPSNDPLGASIIWVASALSVPTADSCVECDGGVSSLTFRYDGRRKARIVVYGKNGRRGRIVLFKGKVRPGDTFTIDSGDVDSPLPKRVWIKMNRCRRVRFRTDCRKPIGPGLKRGKFEIIEAINVGGIPLCPYEPSPPGCPDRDHDGGNGRNGKHGGRGRGH